MEDKNAVKYIVENRVQARRDLDSAKALLSLPDPHLENVAFLLEQSYEKILKAAYVSYKIHTTSDSWKIAYKSTLVHDISFIFAMLRDIHGHYADLVEQNATKYGSVIRELDMFPDSLRKMVDSTGKFKREIMDGIDKIEHKAERLKDRKHFVGFVSKLDSNSIKETNIERTEIPEYIDGLDDLKLMMPELTDLRVLNTKTMQKYITFLKMLKALAPYALPHAVASRYPMKECKMKNLEVYRTSPNLKGFFDKLAYKTQILLDSEIGFTEHLIGTHSEDFDSSNLD